MAASSSNADIPEYFDVEYFRKALENGLRVTDVKILDLNIRNITLGGENYCSNIYQAEVKYSSEMGQKHDRTYDISLIVKSMPRQKQAVLSRLNIYCKETVFYLDIKPKMEALMWHHSSEEWCLAARHLYSTTLPDETIILENLCKQGFQLESRQIGLDEKHALLVMKKLAQYHALTMIMARKEPEIIVNRYPFGLLNIDSIKSPPFKMLFGAQLLKLAEICNECLEFADISKKLLKYHENFTKRVSDAVYPLKGKINVLNHGDLWVNNLFFKYDTDRTVKEVRFIDFQLCYYGSLGFDINYFFNTSVQLDVLKQKRQTLIEIYYKSLVDSLKQLSFGITLPKLEEILKEIKEREAYGFFVAFGFFPLMSMISMDSKDNTLEKFHDEDFSRRKIQLMFKSNGRTMETLKYSLKRLDELGLLE